MIVYGRVFRTPLVCTALALAACSTAPVAPPPSLPELASLPDGGTYKVGNPYEIEGQWYYPAENYAYVEEGVASWYGEEFHNKRTANGERYDMNALTAAHRTLPLPSLVTVTNLDNGRSIQLRVNDRGPFAKSRIIDVSRRAAQLLGFQEAGTARVRIMIEAQESLTLKNLSLRNNQQELPQIAAAPRGAVSALALDPVVATGPAPAPVPLPKAIPPRIAAVAPVPAKAVPAAGYGSGTFVQAGAFTDSSNAQRLGQQLREFGEILVVPTMVNGQQFYRVRLGPLDDEAAAAMLERVRGYGYPDAQIVRY